MSVFWCYENIGSDNREVILTAGDNTQTVVQFQKGYWSFQKIQERLKEENVLLTQNEYNNTCRIYSATHSINLGRFGLLIGFAKDTVIAAGVYKDSGRVNINQYLQYITIGCDAVNTSVVP